jgi:DNA polymerase III epsilon subunit-like protein
MRVLVFDTETTGLPKTKAITEQFLQLWPHIVQLSYIIYDTEIKEIIKIKDCIIKIPKNIIISNESIKLHGITNEISSTNGYDIDYIIEEFIGDLINNNDYIIGHNIDFDIKMIKVELMRLCKQSETIENTDKYMTYISILKNIKQYYCTMQESIEICNIKMKDKYGKEYLKFPKLIELHEKLFNSLPNGLHNSLNDILICLRCFYKIKYDKDITEENDEINRLINKLLV